MHKQTLGRNRRLNPQQVQAIRANLETLGVQADKLGMSRNAVWKIKNRLSYKGVR